MAQYKIDITATTRDANAKISALSTKLDRIKRPNINFGGITSGAKGAALAVGGIATAFAGVSVAIAAASKGIDIMRSSLDAFANRESIGVSLSALLGSDTKGAAKLAELNKIASNTPLALNDIATSYKSMLATLGEDDATTKLFVSIGDAAALTVDNIDNMGNHLQVVTRHVTRAMAAIKNGLSFGTELQELSTMGILSGNNLLQLRGYSSGKSNMSQSEATRLLVSSLGRFNGGMEKLSQTLGGKMSTLGDAIENLKVVFASGFANQFKDIVDDITNAMNNNDYIEAVKGIGNQVGKALQSAWGELKTVTKDMNFTGLIESSGNLVDALIKALPTFVTIADTLTTISANLLSLVSDGNSYNESINYSGSDASWWTKETAANLDRWHAESDSMLADVWNAINMGIGSVLVAPEAIWNHAGLIDTAASGTSKGASTDLSADLKDNIKRLEAGIIAAETRRYGSNYIDGNTSKANDIKHLATRMSDFYDQMVKEGVYKVRKNDFSSAEDINRFNDAFLKWANSKGDTAYIRSTAKYLDNIKSSAEKDSQFMSLISRKFDSLVSDIDKLTSIITPNKLFAQYMGDYKDVAGDNAVLHNMGMEWSKSIISTLRNGGDIGGNRATDPTVTQALNAVVQSLQASGSVGASIGNGYGNILSPTDVIRNMQQQTLDVNHMQLSVQQQILAKITDLDKSNNLASIVFQ